MVTFSKLRDGSWGLRGPGLVTGETVYVSKRGETRPVPKVVGKILWIGDGVRLATIAPTPRKKKACKAPEQEPEVTVTPQNDDLESDPDLNWVL